MNEVCVRQYISIQVISSLFLYINRRNIFPIKTIYCLFHDSFIFPNNKVVEIKRITDFVCLIRDFV